MIYGWREILSHIPSNNSSFDPRMVLLTRWIPRSIPYKEYIQNDHYIILDHKHAKDNANEDLTPSCISTYKEKLTLMPRSHFEEQFSYYDSIQNSSPSVSS